MSAVPQPFSPLRLARREIWILFALVLACRVCAWWAVPIYDDAFITYRYAQNFASGHGLVFNPGEPWEPVLGTTTPAYALLMSLFARLGGDLTWVSPVFNALCDLASAWLILEIVERRRILGGVALLAFAALPQLSRISAGGMESSLFSLLALGAALAFQRERWRIAGTCAALACTVRPEGVLLLGVLFACKLRARRGMVELFAPVLLIGAATVGLMLVFYGDCVPQSVHAKAQMNELSDWHDSLGRVWIILQQSFAPHLTLLVLLPVVLWGALKSLAHGPALRVFALFALAITVSYLAARPHVWGWYFHVPLTAWCLWLGLGTEALLRKLHERIPERTLVFGSQRAILFGAPLALVCFATAALLYRVPVRERVYVPLQNWARATSKLQPHARILAADIGAIGWAWSGTVLDSEGLTWPQAFLYKLPNRMIEEFKPEYLLIVAERPRVEHFYGAPELRERYEPIARFSVDGDTNLEPTIEELSPVWKQDYLLYRRLDLKDD